jgi:hypothetical protein
MHNITLIGTRHEKNEPYNLLYIFFKYELYRIIERINPETIFEEIPPSAFDDYYKNKNRDGLESDTISEYVETHQIKHIPVDSDNMPPDSFWEDNKYLHGRIESLSFEYRKLLDANTEYARMYGFKYLNSIYNDNLCDELYNAMENTLQKINDEKLFQTYKSWNDINDKRENEMLRNIYRYCGQHKFDRGLFLIGSAHRKSIINKIQEYEKTAELKLNWNYGDYENIL